MFKIQSIAPSLALDQKHNKQPKERSGGSERGQGTHEQQAQSMANQTLRHCLLNEVPKIKRGTKSKERESIGGYTSSTYIHGETAFLFDESGLFPPLFLLQNLNISMFALISSYTVRGIVEMSCEFPIRYACPCRLHSCCVHSLTSATF